MHVCGKYKHFLVSLGLILILSSTLVRSINVTTQITDVNYLLLLKNALIDTRGDILSGWIGDPCTYSTGSSTGWLGIQCTPLQDVYGRSYFAVVSIRLPDSQLGGSLSSVYALGKMSQLQVIDLHNNSLSGSLPPDIGSNAGLVQLDLSNNNFEGPLSISPLSPIAILNVSSNNLSGALNSSMIGKLKSLLLIDLSGNNFSGNIPETFSTLNSLQTISLANNSFYGRIPSSLSTQSNLTVINLENNNLCGVAPPALLQSSIHVQLAGNPNLCLDPNSTVSSYYSAMLSVCPANMTYNSSSLVCFQPRDCNCSSNKTGTQSFSTQSGWADCQCSHEKSTVSYVVMEGYVRLLIILMAVVIFILLVYTAYHTCYAQDGCIRKFVMKNISSGSIFEASAKTNPMTPAKKAPSRRHAQRRTVSLSSHAASDTSSRLPARRTAYFALRPLASSSPGGESPAHGGWDSMPVQLFTLQEICDATNNFAGTNVLGSYGLLRSYRATLDDGTLAVVKELNSIGEREEDDVLKLARDVEWAGSVKHRNLVKIYGLCVEENCRLLVVEHVANGSLDRHLFDIQGRFILNWNRRMHILLGVARGMEHLHDHNPPITYQTLSSSKVLLDRDFDPKLNHVLTIIRSHQIQAARSSTTRAIACGLMAPELAWTGAFDTATDVYLFGVLLLEVITGLRAFDIKRNSNEQSLPKWARPRLTHRNEVDALVDWRLCGIYCRSALYQLALLAWQCIHVDPTSRPNMAQAVELLQKLQNLPLDCAEAGDMYGIHRGRTSSFKSWNVRNEPQVGSSGHLGENISNHSSYSSDGTRPLIC